MSSGIPRYFYPLLIGLSIFVVLTGLWVLGPDLIESSYQGKSIPIINSMISNQKEHTLEEYLNRFSSLLTLPSMAGVILIYFLSVFFIMEKRKNDVSDINAKKQNGSFSLAEKYWFFLGLSIILGWITYALTILPGITYVNIMTHDTFIFFDGIYRLSQGQVPHLDFHTPIGPLSYLLPYLGFSIVNKFPGSMELSNFIVAMLVLAISIHVLSSRYRVIPSIMALVFLVVLIIMPMNVGSQDITHAMYYNRYGWVLLSLLFLFFIEPGKKSRTQLLVDSICVGILVAMLFYIKITYFVVAAAIFPLMIFSSGFLRQVAIYSFALFVMIIIIVELMLPGMHYQYLRDILMAIDASGAVRNGLLKTIELNIDELLLSFLALFFMFRVRRINVYEFGYVVLVVLSGLMLINQNAQNTGLVTVVVLLLWSHEMSSRNDVVINGIDSPGTQSVLVSTVILSLIMLFVSQTLVHRIMGLDEFYNVAISKSKQAQYSTSLMDDLFVGERYSYLSQVVNKKNIEELFNEMRVKRRKQPLTQGEYLETIEQGLLLMDGINIDGDSVIVFDLANPFSFLLSSRPPTGDYSWLHKGRNISKNNYIMPEKLFKSVRYVMIPKFPMETPVTPFLTQTYGSYISNKFNKIADNSYWEVYEKVL